MLKREADNVIGDTQIKVSDFVTLTYQLLRQDDVNPSVCIFGLPRSLHERMLEELWKLEVWLALASRLI
jgi:hypothetical protein